MYQSQTTESDQRLIRSLIEEQYSYFLTSRTAYISYIPRPFIELCVGNDDPGIIPLRRNFILEGVFEKIWTHYIKTYPRHIFSRRDEAFVFMRNCLILLRRAHDNGLAGELPPLRSVYHPYHADGQ